jgi:hypothetical protein
VSVAEVIVTFVSFANVWTPPVWALSDVIPPPEVIIAETLRRFVDEFT